MANKDREQLWEVRVAQWQASGLSQRAYSIKEGFPIHQVGYWVRRPTNAQGVPALLPVSVAPPAALATINLRRERGWHLTLPSDVPAGWLAELIRAL